MAKLKRAALVVGSATGLALLARLEPVLLVLVVGTMILLAAVVAVGATTLFMRDGRAARRLRMLIRALRERHH